MGRDSDTKDEKMHFQMNRFVQQNGQWFYTTREGEERGPFDNKSDAQGDLLEYIQHLRNLQKFGLNK